MDGNPGVRALRPDLPPVRGDHVSLGAIKADIGQRHFHRPFAVGLRFEGNIAPEGDGERILSRRGWR